MGLGRLQAEPSCRQAIFLRSRRRPWPPYRRRIAAVSPPYRRRIAAAPGGPHRAAYGRGPGASAPATAGITDVLSRGRCLVSRSNGERGWERYDGRRERHIHSCAVGGSTRRPDAGRPVVDTRPTRHRGYPSPATSSGIRTSLWARTGDRGEQLILTRGSLSGSPIDHPARARLSVQRPSARKDPSALRASFARVARDLAG